MKNHQDILQFIYFNTQSAMEQVTALEYKAEHGAFKSYLQELAQKYKVLNQTARKHLEFVSPDAAEQIDSASFSPYMAFESKALGKEDSDMAELLMQHSVLGIVQIKKQVRACQNREKFPHNFYNLLLELLDTEQFNLRCLQAFL